ncbi:COG1/VPS51 family protein [Sporobolomyces koalae]|uniref:COG1/VPS51 family protein n=1 Tax=Sporobolomyces koalae TaxID=500713 RepID=UPI003170988B
MATTTPRRPLYAPSVSDISSTPSSLPRRPSSLRSSSAADSPASASGTERKKRNRTLLRDYYGLGPNKGDALDLDSPDTFDPAKYFAHLTTTAKIRELDGERQSLVYNHHHELIEASDTIRKMKSRAEALDSSLESLKTSFEKISQLSTSLAPTQATSRPNRTRLAPARSPSLPQDSPETPTKPRLPRTTSSASSSTPVFSPILHLAPLLALPILLRVLDRSKGDALWGSWEPALRSWEDERVEGVAEIGRECRDVLRGGRRASVSAGVRTVEPLEQDAQP